MSIHAQCSTYMDSFTGMWGNARYKWLNLLHAVTTQKEIPSSVQTALARNDLMLELKHFRVQNNLIIFTYSWFENILLKITHKINPRQVYFDRRWNFFLCRYFLVKTGVNAEYVRPYFEIWIEWGMSIRMCLIELTNEYDFSSQYFELILLIVLIV